MEPEGSMPHSQGLSNNPYPERINPIPHIDMYFLTSILILSSHIRLSLPKGLFPVGLPTKILKTLVNYAILVTSPAHLNFIDLITLAILGERYKL